MAANFPCPTGKRGGKETALPGKFGIPLELPFATVTVRTTSHFSSGSIGRPIFVERLSVKETCAQMLGRLSVTRPDSKGKQPAGVDAEAFPSAEGGRCPELSY